MVSMQKGNASKLRRDFDSFEPSNATAFRMLGLHFVVTIGLIVILCLLQSRLSFLVVASAILLGYMFARGLELGHALQHGRFFSENLWRLNRIIGCTVTMPFLLPWTQWKWTHFHHHKDPRIEGFDYPDVRSIRDLPSLVGHHLMYSHWIAVLRRTFLAYAAPEKVRDEINGICLGTAALPDSIHRKIIFEYRLNFWVLGGLLISFWMFVDLAAPTMLIVWLSASITHVMIEFPEHVLANLDDPDPENNSFEITASPVADMLMMNNTRHATHHRFPEVPAYYLPTVSRQLKHKHASKNYVSFWWRFAGERLTYLGFRDE